MYRVVFTHMVEVEITLVAAQVILFLVSDKRLFFVSVSCVYPKKRDGPEAGPREKKLIPTEGEQPEYKREKRKEKYIRPSRSHRPGAIWKIPFSEFASFFLWPVLPPTQKCR